VSDGVNGVVVDEAAVVTAALVEPPTETFTIGEVDTTGLLVDPTRLKHKHAKRLTFLQLTIQSPVYRMKMSPAEVAKLLDEVDEILTPCVVSVPKSWLPDGMTIASAGWIDELNEGQWHAIFNLMGAMPQPAGKKTG
jgi:hypothetical protein